MYLIHNNEVGKIKNFKTNGWYKDKIRKAYRFNVEQEVRYAKDIKLSLVLTASSELNIKDRAMMVRIAVDLLDDFTDSRLEEVKKYLFSHFSQKEYMDFFFEIPVSSEIEDEYKSKNQVIIRLSGMAKIDPEIEYAYKEISLHFPEIEMLENEKTKSFFDKKIVEFLDDIEKNKMKSRLIELSKVFDLNSDEYFDAISLVYEY